MLRHARAHARDVTRRILSISGGPGLALGSQDRDYLESRPLVSGRSCGSGKLQPERPVVAGVGIIEQGGTGDRGGNCPPCPPARYGPAFPICSLMRMRRKGVH